MKFIADEDLVMHMVWVGDSPLSRAKTSEVVVTAQQLKGNQKTYDDSM